MLAQYLLYHFGHRLVEKYATLTRVRQQRQPGGERHAVVRLIRRGGKPLEPGKDAVNRSAAPHPEACIFHQYLLGQEACLRGGKLDIPAKRLA